jgi:hypothetical protein
MLYIVPEALVAGKNTIPKGTTEVMIPDHFGGFDSNYRNATLDHLNEFGPMSVSTEYIFNDNVKQNYPNLDFKFNLDMHVIGGNLQPFANYKSHPPLTFENFVCSFSGTNEHVGKKLLLAIIHKFGWFKSEYTSKNFRFSVDELDGHISDYIDNNRLYRKFFFGNDDREFFNSLNSFNYNNKDHFDNYNHRMNINVLEHKLTKSFLHLVSETMPTSYHPFYGEKHLYSVVTRGLFVSYANPYYHQNLKKHYGFRLYDTLFDYTFDGIKNPVIRLVELITMLSKYSHMSLDDWRDLYGIEQENIEFNYNHYHSGDYLTCLKRYDNPDSRITKIVKAKTI